jgi:light-regulated signal transduction histidine kinase (bacteriophytochrome)
MKATLPNPASAPTKTDEVHDLKRLLEQKAHELEAAHKELESLAYSVSHDLRAPLRAIEGFARILSEDYASRLDDEGRRYLEIVAASASKMNRLMDDLLAYSRLSRVPLQISRFQPGSLIESVFQEVQAQEKAPKRAARLTVQPLPSIDADEALIRQLFRHLLSNALKFAQPEETARIEIGQISRDDETVFYVRDNGAGFDMQYAGKLFGLFQRLHSSEEISGEGVGLAMAQRIVHRHHGQIWAEAKPNEGATFYFTLPAPKGAVPDGRA